jgi:hypothetical protein
MDFVTKENVAMAKKTKATFIQTFTVLLARNEEQYAKGKKPLTDEDLLIELSHLLPDSGSVRKLLSGKISIHTQRGRFNRGELHYQRIDGPPKFFSFKYNRHGSRVYRTRPITAEQQLKLIEKWKAKRASYLRRANTAPYLGIDEPTFLSD